MKLSTRTLAGGVVRLDLEAETDEEKRGLRTFVRTCNDGVSIEDSQAALDRPMRLESVGFDDAQHIDSIAIHVGD